MPRHGLFLLAAASWRSCSGVIGFAGPSLRGLPLFTSASVRVVSIHTPVRQRGHPATAAALGPRSLESLDGLHGFHVAGDCRP
jgi:hypothetical protein